MQSRELRDLHAVEPDLSAEPPRARRQVLPVVLNETVISILGLSPNAIPSGFAPPW